MKTQLQKYEYACNQLATAFLGKYYCDKDTTLADFDYYWIGDQVAGVLSIGDEFWSMNDIVDAARYKPSREKLFEYYYYRLDLYEKDQHEGYNMESYLKLKPHDKNKET